MLYRQNLSREVKYYGSDDGSEKDVADIYNFLKEYNLSQMEKSQNIPLGIFMENEDGNKLAGLTGDTFGNWMCIRYLWVSEELRGKGIGKK